MRVFEINAKKSKKDLQEICLLLFIFLRESIQSFTMNFSCRLLQWPVNSMARCTDRHRSLVVQTSNRDEISAVCVIYENRVFRKYRCLHGTRSSGDNRRNSTAVMQLDRRHHRHHCCQMKRIGLCRLKFLRRNLQFESVEFWRFSETDCSFLSPRGKMWKGIPTHTMNVFWQCAAGGSFLLSQLPRISALHETFRLIGVNSSDKKSEKEKREE